MTFYCLRSWQVFLCLMLFLSGTLCFSGLGDSSAIGSSDGGFLPPWVQLSMSILRWGLLAYISLLTIKEFSQDKCYSTISQRVLAVFFVFLFLISCLAGDIVRYSLMTITTVLIPLFVAEGIAKVGEVKFLRVFSYASIFLMLVHLWISLQSGTTFVRYTGFVSNANAFAGINLFLTLICLAGTIAEKNIFRKWMFSVAVLCGACGQLFCASRAGFVCLVISVAIFLYKSGRLNVKILLLGGGGLGIVLTVFFANSSDFLLRVFELGDSVSDSGRADVWAAVFGHLERNPFGFGTLARQEFGIGNCHNMYVALLFMAGYIGGGVLILIYLGSVVAALLECRTREMLGEGKIVGALGCSYVCVMLLYCMAEDSLLGLGAPWFIYLMISLGALGYAQKVYKEKGRVLFR